MIEIENTREAYMISSKRLRRPLVIESLNPWIINHIFPGCEVRDAEGRNQRPETRWVILNGDTIRGRIKIIDILNR